MDRGSIYGFIYEGIIFLTFLTVCSMLTVKRFDRKTSSRIAGGFLLVVIGSNLFLLLTGRPWMQILSLLPLTAYLPMIISIHFLSKASFFQTTAIWNIGLIGYFLQKFTLKILKTMGSGVSSNVIPLMGAFCTSIAMLFFLSKYIRKPLKMYILELRMNWIVMWMPLLFISALFSYFSWSTINPMVSGLLFLTALAIFLLLSKVLGFAYESMCLRQKEGNLALQIRTQKHDYESICKKIEMGRMYRHDMRHHFAALDTLLQQGNKEEALTYIRRLNDTFNQMEHEAYCENLAVNAILCFYVAQGKAADCNMKVNVQIPKALLFDEVDLCIIFSNALENAIHACKRIADKKKRRIIVSTSYEKGKMVISIENTCFDPIKFDQAGFPITEKRAGHGIGLKSIEAVVKKYYGFFSCALNGTVFSIKTVLFERHDTSCTIKKTSKEVAKQALAINGFVILLFCLFVNTTPSIAMTLEKVPIVGKIVDVITLKSFHFKWGDTQLDLPLPNIEIAIGPQEKEPTPSGAGNLPEKEESIDKKKQTPREATFAAIDLPKLREEDLQAEIEEPTVIEPDPPASKEIEIMVPNVPEEKPREPENPKDSDLSQGIEEMNQQMEAYVEKLRQEFIQYVSMKHDGYVGMDCEYTVLCNNEAMISIRFDTVMNLGGSGTVCRIFTLDKQKGKVMELKDLFVEEGDYIQKISSEIMKQMKEQVEAGTGDYFIPGGIWSDDECFKGIEPDQNFYINDQGKLVIVFDEYLVAPGKMGCPEFIIPTQEIETLLIDLRIIQ